MSNPWYQIHDEEDSGEQASIQVYSTDEELPIETALDTFAAQLDNHTVSVTEYDSEESDE